MYFFVWDFLNETIVYKQAVEELMELYVSQKYLVLCSTLELQVLDIFTFVHLSKISLDRPYKRKTCCIHWSHDRFSTSFMFLGKHRIGTISIWNGGTISYHLPTLDVFSRMLRMYEEQQPILQLKRNDKILFSHKGAIIEVFKISIGKQFLESLSLVNTIQLQSSHRVEQFFIQDDQIFILTTEAIYVCNYMKGKQSVFVQWRKSNSFFFQKDNQMYAIENGRIVRKLFSIERNHQST